MNQAQESPLESEIGDFAEILRHKDARELPVVVGGHAAGLWSRYFLSRGVTELAEFLPFRSKDLDLVGTVGLLDELHRRFKGRLLRSEPRSPVFGRLDIPQSGGGFLRVEVLHTVLGLDAKDMMRTVDIDVAGVVARVPLPHLMLKAKLANSALITQDGRQDVKHTKMMLICVRAFILELLDNHQRGLIGERPVVNLLEEIREVMSSPNAEKAANLWSIDFREVWPREELKASGGEKVVRWLEHRLA
jgi:hypothetical protein